MIQSKSVTAKLTALFYAIVSLVGIGMMYYPTLLSGFAKLQAERSDTRLNHYFLEHSFRVLFDRTYIGSLWTPSFFYPFQNTLAMSDNLLGSAPIYWMFRAFMAEDYAYQIWMMVVVWLSFVAYVILLRKFQVSHPLAALGGFLFAFGLPRAAQMGHQQLFPQFFTPIAFLFIWQFIQKPTLTKLAWALGFIYLQILAGVYLGWFLVLSLLVFIPVIFYLDRAFKQRLTTYLKASWKPTIAAFLLWGIGMLWLFRPYLNMGKLTGERPYSAIAESLPRLTSWFLPAPHSLWSSWLSPFAAGTPMIVEHYLFIGFGALILIGIALYTLISRSDVLDPERTLLAKSCLITALILFVLSLSVSDHSLWLLIFKLLPGANSIRAVTRIVFILYFYLFIGVLLYVDALLKRTVTKPRIRTAIAVGFLLLTLPEQLIWAAPSYDRFPVLKTEAELQELMSKGCDFAYMELDGKDFFYNQQTQAMWAGIRVNVPVINGYSGAEPPGLPMQKNVELAGLLDWLHFASTGTAKGRLCLIQSTRSLNQPSRGMSIASINQAQQFKTANFTSFVIPVSPNTPLQQFSQAMRVITQSPKTLKVNTELDLPVLVRNTGDFTWFRGGNAPVTFSYRWLNNQQVVEPIESERTLLPFNLPPNQAAALNAKITTPSRPGEYTLQLTMVQEAVAWFVDKGAKPLNLSVRVNP
jgi:hypothetical protein